MLKREETQLLSSLSVGELDETGNNCSETRVREIYAPTDNNKVTRRSQGVI